MKVKTGIKCTYVFKALNPMLLLKRYQSLQQISNKCTAIRECMINI